MSRGFKRKEKFALKAAFLFLLLFWVCAFQARLGCAAALPGSEFNMKIRNRVEVIAATEGLSDPYGRWNSLNMNYFQRAREDTLLFVQLTGHSRPEGGGVQSNFGVVKDWNKSFFTQTSVGFGSNVNYLPSITVNQDFNFKFGKEQRYIWSVGGSYFKYFNDTSSLILKSGIGIYQDKWVFDYHIFRNMSNPGSVESFSHQFSAAYGVNKRYWTTLTYSFGRQAYLASSLGIPEAVNNYSQYVSLNYRRWLGPNQGFVAEINYLKLLDAYNKLGFSLGFFNEY